MSAHDAYFKGKWSSALLMYSVVKKMSVVLCGSAAVDV